MKLSARNMGPVYPNIPVFCQLGLQHLDASLLLTVGRNSLSSSFAGHVEMYLGSFDSTWIVEWVASIQEAGPEVMDGCRV